MPQILGVAEILKIKETALVTAASFIAEVGDRSRFPILSKYRNLQVSNLEKTAQVSTRKV